MENEEAIENCDKSEQIKQNKTSNVDLYDSIIEKQNHIIDTTSVLSGKCEQIDELTKTELEKFNLASKKYGMYLKLIQSEFFMIEDLIKKINKEFINKK